MNWKRALVTGFFDWLSPFLASLALYPLLAYDKFLYANILAFFHLPVGLVLLIIYSGSRALPVREAVSVTTLWTAMNLIIDQPIFVFGPFNLGLRRYFSEIGITYFSIIAFAYGAATLHTRWGGARDRPPDAAGADPAR